jgi:hypothetical protein
MAVLRSPKHPYTEALPYAHKFTLPSSFPRRRESRNVHSTVSSNTMRRYSFGSHSAGENVLDSRLCGNDGGFSAFAEMTKGGDLCA